MYLKKKMKRANKLLPYIPTHIPTHPLTHMHTHLPLPHTHIYTFMNVLRVSKSSKHLGLLEEFEKKKGKNLGTIKGKIWKQK